MSDYGRISVRILGPRIVDGAVVKTGADWRNRLTTTRGFHGKRMVCELGGHWTALFAAAPAQLSAQQNTEAVPIGDADFGGVCNVDAVAHQVAALPI